MREGGAGQVASFVPLVPRLALMMTGTRRPRARWRLTAPRAVILELARESRGTEAIPLVLWIPAWRRE